MFCWKICFKIVVLQNNFEGIKMLQLFTLRIVFDIKLDAYDIF